MEKHFLLKDYYSCSHANERKLVQIMVKLSSTMEVVSRQTAHVLVLSFLRQYYIQSGFWRQHFAMARQLMTVISIIC